MEQCIILAVARQRQELPKNWSATEDLLACLNAGAPESPPEHAVRCPTDAVQACFSESVTVVSREFLVW